VLEVNLKLVALNLGDRAVAEIFVADAQAERDVETRLARS